MDDVQYGGFFQRYRAFIVDIFALIVISTAVLLSLRYVFFMNINFQFIVISVAGIVFLYFTLLESSFLQGSLGKVALKMKLVAENGERITYITSVKRFFIKCISFLPYGLPLIVVGFSKKKQGLHDMFAKSYVVKYKEYDELIHNPQQKLILEKLQLIGKYSVYIVASAVILGILSSVLSSMFHSQVAKDIGNFIALVIGAIIWGGIFYVIFKVKNSSLGQGVSSVLSSVGDAFSETEEEKLKRKELQRQKKADKSKSNSDTLSTDEVEDTENRYYVLKFQDEMNPFTELTYEEAMDISTKRDYPCYITYEKDLNTEVIGTYKKGKKISDKRTW